jgi:hypothetical protein
MTERARSIVLLLSLALSAGVLSIGVLGNRDGCSTAGLGWFGYTPLTHTKIELPSGKEACHVAIYRGS